MKKIIYPCDSRRITSKFGPRSLSADGFHDGLDFGPITNSDDVYSVDEGIVVKSYLSSSYGNCIIIQHDNFCSLYAHLSVRHVIAGQTISQGDKIGKMGNTGHSTGTHLHFEIRTGNYDNKFFNSDSNGQFFNSVDPLLWLEFKKENADLEFLLQHRPPIFDSGDYWQRLIDNNAKLSEVSVETFLAVIKKVVERD